MIENFWILKYNLMVMFNIWNLIRLKQTSNNPQRFTTQVKNGISFEHNFLLSVILPD